MNKINVVILEDDLLFQIKLESMLYDTEFSLMKIFDSPLTIEKYMSETRVDIVISDIYIGNNPDGGELIKRLCKRNIPVVCITSSQEDKIYVELDECVSGYLIKPFHKITLLSALRKAIKEYKKDETFDFIDKKYLMVTGKSGKLEKINLTDIVYLEASGNYTFIVTEKAKYAKKISMNKLLHDLDKRFRRIHSKFTINTQMLKNMTATSLTLNNGQVYPISKNYKKNLKDL